jgi:hypothetical protein
VKQAAQRTVPRWLVLRAPDAAINDDEVSEISSKLPR